MTDNIKNKRKRYIAPAALLGFGLVCCGTLFFMWLAGREPDSSFGRLDCQLLLSLRNPDDVADPLGPLWMEEAFRDVTALGGITVLAMFSIVVCGYFLLRKQYRSTILLLTAVVGGFLANSILKTAYDRPRPDLVPHHTRIFTPSFPSSHAMLSAITYLTAAILVTRRHRRKSVRWFLMVVSLLVVTAIGASRVYLGVHWPSDVLGGWTAGAVWAFCFWKISDWIEVRQ